MEAGPLPRRLAYRLAEPRRRSRSTPTEVVAAYLAGIRSTDPHKAAEAWLSRVHGRPMQTVETSSTDDGLAEIRSLSREARDALLRTLAIQNPEIAAELGIDVPVDIEQAD